MDSLLSWLRLVSVPGIGPFTIKRLVDTLGSAEAVFQTSADQLLNITGIAQRHAAALAAHPVPAEAHRQLERIAKTPYQLVAYTDPEYPSRLREIPNPPPLLYVFGHIPAAIDGLAIVGSRAATVYGKKIAHQLAMDLNRCGLTIVSGMATGIDGAAHQGALDAGGPTVAVLGCGIDQIYPPNHHRLYHQIAENGAVISELPLGSAPLAHHFPARNRIISGICHGTLVVEAGRRSGSLITAKVAIEQNREVFAVPGNVRSFKSTGTHTLIKQGAKLVEHAQDIVDELEGMRGVSHGFSQESTLSTPNLSETAEKVLSIFESDPILVDDLASRTRLPIAKLSNALLELELANCVMACPGNRYARQ